MKLRNKRTGEVVVEVNKIGLVWNRFGMPADIGQYDSLAELNEEWEDYTPKEPLIKDDDKERRKLLKNWASINGLVEVFYHELRGGGGCYFELPSRLMRQGYSIMFSDIFEGLEDEKGYTIAELCGEEEE